MAAVLRRLVRVCLYYGRSPQFLCCSATIANPAEHMKRLVPLDALYRHSASNRHSDAAGVARTSTSGAKSDGSSDVSSRIDTEDKDTCDYYLEVVGADLDGAPQGERFETLWFLLSFDTSYRCILYF